MIQFIIFFKKNVLKIKNYSVGCFGTCGKQGISDRHQVNIKSVPSGING